MKSFLIWLILTLNHVKRLERWLLWPVFNKSFIAEVSRVQWLVQAIAGGLHRACHIAFKECSARHQTSNAHASPGNQISRPTTFLRGAMDGHRMSGMLDDDWWCRMLLDEVGVGQNWDWGRQILVLAAVNHPSSAVPKFDRYLLVIPVGSCVSLKNWNLVRLKQLDIPTLGSLDFRGCSRWGK